MGFFKKLAENINKVVPLTKIEPIGDAVTWAGENPIKAGLILGAGVLTGGAALGAGGAAAAGGAGGAAGTAGAAGGASLAGTAGLASTGTALGTAGTAATATQGAGTLASIASGAGKAMAGLEAVQGVVGAMNQPKERAPVLGTAQRSQRTQAPMPMNRKDLLNMYGRG